MFAKGGSGHRALSPKVTLSHQGAAIAFSILLVTDHEPSLAPDWALALLRAGCGLEGDVEL